MNKNMTLFSILLVKVHFLSAKHLLQPGGAYISSDLGYMSQNIFLPLITPIIKPMIGNKKTIFPIPVDIRGTILFICKFKDRKFYRQSSWSRDGEPTSIPVLWPDENPARC